MEIKKQSPPLQDFKRKAFENPEVEKEYDRIKPVYEKLRSNLNNSS